ncbi:outer membrane porin, OmpC family [Burkholderia sp. H160]|nr:outer membrane porin, OmpC family [Burkholderia sp. H160]
MTMAGLLPWRHRSACSGGVPVAAYAYTAATKANTITDAARYNQISASQFYSLSKRTGLYSVEGYTRASGKTLGSGGTSVINATATVGDGSNSTPSSSRSQVAVAVGMIAKF